MIEQHKLWGTRHVAIGGMPLEYRDSEAGFRRFAEIANGIGERLYGAGLTFSYHNHSFEFLRFGARSGLELIFDETDARYVQAELGYLLDSAWRRRPSGLDREDARSDAGGPLERHDHAAGPPLNDGGDFPYRRWRKWARAI